MTLLFMPRPSCFILSTGFAIFEKRGKGLLAKYLPKTLKAMRTLYETQYKATKVEEEKEEGGG